jgi:chromosome segregation ATPase
MFADATSLWFTASNVIQSLNNNITSALESLDEELGEHEEKSDEDIYKKLLEDAQMQHFELSKQFRVIVSEKDAELEIWKKKCGELGTIDPDEVQAEIDTAKLQSELNVLRETVQNMEGEIKVLLESSNETIGKLSRYNDIVKERDDLKNRLTDAISSSGELETQKSGELEGLVAEYSKLAAESESQKSSDSLRIRELELENEELVTKMHALEHSIGELADRSAGIKHPNRIGTHLRCETSFTTCRRLYVNIFTWLFIQCDSQVCRQRPPLQPGQGFLRVHHLILLPLQLMR